MLNNLDKYIVKYNWFTFLKVWNYIFYPYSELESFCFSCFILFFPNTNREYYFLKNNITSLEIEDLKDVKLKQNKNYVYVFDGNNLVSFRKKTVYHPFCSKHRYLIKNNWKKYYIDNINKSYKINIDNFNLSEYETLVWKWWIVKKYFKKDIWLALSVNPYFYFENWWDLLYTCSWYQDYNLENSVKIAIMEWIERFCSFLPYIKSFKILQKDLPKKSNSFLDNFYYVFEWFYENYNLNTYNRFIRVFDLKKRDVLFFPKDYFLVANNKSYNYVNSTWTASHFDYRKAILSWIYEIIERDALMKLWFYQYSPNEYSVNSFHKKNFSYVWNITKNYNIKFLKVESVFWYVTLALWLRKKKNKNLPIFFYGSWFWLNQEDSLYNSYKELYKNFQNIWLFEYKILLKNQVKSVNDHYIYYLNENNFKKITFIFKNNKKINLNYLKKELKNFEQIINEIPFNVFIFDMTPEFIKQKWIFVVKSFSPDLQPMDFWYWLLKLNKNLDLSRISKKSILEPHPFF